MKKFRQVGPVLFFALIGFCPVQSLAQTDMGAIGLAVPVQKSCYSNAEKVSVKIKNHSTFSHNFSITPVTVNMSVTGPNAISFPSVIVNTGTLPAGDSLTVVITNSYNMTAIGTYIFSSSTITSGDVNTANNAMPAVSITVSPAPAVLSTTPANRCGPGTVTLGATSTPGSTIQWLTAPVGGSVVGTGNSFTTPSLVSGTTYYAAAWIGGGSANVGINVNDFAICGFPESSTALDKPLRFTIAKPVILNSAYIIPQATTVTVALRPNNSTVNIVTKTFNFNS